MKVVVKDPHWYFYAIGTGARFWSFTELYGGVAWLRGLSLVFSEVNCINNDNRTGDSVLCIRD
jgi:hypothetical protein